VKFLAERELKLGVTLLLMLVASGLLASSASGQQLAGDPLDLNSVKQDFYEIVLSSAMGGGLQPGDGVNMTDPFNPRQTPFSPFHTDAPTNLSSRQISSADISNQVISIYSTYYDSLSVEEEAHLLSANFKASYGLASAEAAYQQTQTSRKTGKAVYFIYQIGGWSVPVNSAHISWNGTDLTAINSVADRNLMLRQFISNYGSHYVLSIVYGARIAIRAQMNTLDTSKQQSLSVQIHASLGALAAGGGISTEDRAALSSSNVSITAEIAAGGITPSRQLVMTSFDQISKFLSDFNAGTITLTSGPISAKVQSYWPTLASTNYSNIADALAPATGPEHSPAPFGVPSGTITAWAPKAGDIQSVGGATRILAPVGWLICDGTNGTPDLREKYLIGTTANDVLTQVGAPTHTHSVTGTTNVGNGHVGWVPNTQFETHGGDTFSQTYTFTTTTDPASSLPPSVRVVFIMKQ
jgi:hypothetical protein